MADTVDKAPFGLNDSVRLTIPFVIAKVLLFGVTKTAGTVQGCCRCVK